MIIDTRYLRERAACLYGVGDLNEGSLVYSPNDDIHTRVLDRLLRSERRVTAIPDDWQFGIELPDECGKFEPVAYGRACQRSHSHAQEVIAQVSRPLLPIQIPFGI